MKNYIKSYLLVLGSKKKQIPLIFIFFLLASLLDLFGLSLVAPLIYSIISPESFNDRFDYSFIPNYFFDLSHLQKVIHLGSILLFVYYAKAYSGFLLYRKIVIFSLNHQAYLIKTLVRSYQRMPYSDLLQKNTATFYNMISNHVRLYTEQTLMASLKLMSEAIIFLAILSFLGFANIYALIFLVIMFAIIFISYDFLFKNIYQTSGKKTAESIDKVLRNTKEAIGSLKEVRILNKEEFFNKKVEMASNSYAHYGSLSQALQQIPRYLLESVIITFIVILAIYSIYSGQEIAHTIALIGVFGVGSIRLLPSAYQSMVAISLIRFSSYHLYKLSDDLSDHIKNKLIDNNCISEYPRLHFEMLQVQNMNYKYPTSTNYILNNISFNIKKGEFIGIIGESGSGKTTLVDILLGLLIPKTDDGEIFINNKPLRDQVSEWQNILAYIPQSIFLLDSTIKENITLEDKDSKINFDMLDNAIETSQLNKTINSLSNGLETNVGDDGIRLSGGERQRIILARAIYHQKEIIIFDEATSSLDSDTEKSIMKDIYRFKGNKTIIIISHKLDILNECDKIIKISNGKINYTKLDNMTS